MKVALAIFGVLALLGSLGSCALARGVVQETEGVVMLVVAVILIGFSALLQQMERHTQAMVDQFAHLAEFLKERLK